MNAIVKTVGLTAASVVAAGATAKWALGHFEESGRRAENRRWDRWYDDHAKDLAQLEKGVGMSVFAHDPEPGEAKGYPQAMGGIIGVAGLAGAAAMLFSPATVVGPKAKLAAPAVAALGAAFIFGVAGISKGWSKGEKEAHQKRGFDPAEQAAHIITNFDKNRDRKIHVGEDDGQAVEYLKRLPDSVRSSYQEFYSAERSLKSADIDKNGDVDEAELVKYFRAFDENGDGRVSEHERAPENSPYAVDRLGSNYTNAGAVHDGAWNRYGT